MKQIRINYITKDFFSLIWEEKKSVYKKKQAQKQGIKITILRTYKGFMSVQQGSSLSRSKVSKRPLVKSL